MDKPLARIAGVFASLFVVMVALLFILRIFDVVDGEMLKTGVVKIAAALVVLVVATGVIVGLQSTLKK